jgi:hypothetical protein
VYVWHAGYWGPHIGFYGGVNYGFGYFGNGYEGGYWRDRHFYYNRTVNNINITNVHIYNKTVINNVTVNRISYNGGRGGIMTRPTHEQETWSREHHFEPTNLQRDHEHAAGGNRALWASENHGRPSIAATSRPGEFHGPRVMPARTSGGPYDRPAVRPVPRPQYPDRNSARPMHSDNGARSSDRPMPREDMHGNRGPQPDYNAHRDQGPRPGNDRPQNAAPRDNGHGHDNAAPHSNGGPHESAPHEGKEQHSDRGHDERPR